MLQKLFFLFIIRPILLIILGMNVRHKERLPKNGPAILVANHNSHLDTLVLMSLYPLRDVKMIRPVAAADYFLKNKWISWFSRTIIRIIPIARRGTKTQDPFKELNESIQNNEILIFFPEGSRGEAERFEKFKSGIAHLSAKHPTVPIYPIFMYGLGKSLPKGDPILVPFFLDIFIGEAVFWNGNKDQFLKRLHDDIQALRDEGRIVEWE
ncbi:lysophospholipid acyltransferase family protein [Salirhabdus salicampi]|uniref:lysophospholipid acyltransferase family protein n=1 Tax=Salirhabdus salicampi TaxID=476102 RepID=UPI0020C43D00|nr:lysophospholipid acyltransferase family protein [Salirhabdus salicampi]MCP8616287.1 1-acyl-sn-glycerol-3-phosphate acyltransferase [Salirhabdus salicampi]